MRHLIFLFVISITAFAAKPTWSAERVDKAKIVAEQRIAFCQTTAYEPYGDKVRECRENADKALSEARFGEALSVAQSGLGTNPFDIDLLIIAAAASRELGEPRKADELRARWMSIVDSILVDSDGRSPASAFRVIAVDEEYALLKVLGLRSQRQALISSDGRYFDVLTLVDATSGKPAGDLYFDVSIPRLWLAKQFEGHR